MFLLWDLHPFFCNSSVPNIAGPVIGPFNMTSYDHAKMAIETFNLWVVLCVALVKQILKFLSYEKRADKPTQIQ